MVSSELGMEFHLLFGSVTPRIFAFVSHIYADIFLLSYLSIDAAAMFLECLWYTLIQNNKKNSNRFLNRVIFCKTTFPIAGLSRL